MNPYGISLRQPAAGDIVGTEIVIAAVGTAFEASYVWWLHAGDDILAEGYFQAGSMGALSAFAQTVDTSAVTYAGRAVLRLAGDNPLGEDSTADAASVEVYVVPGAQGYVPHQVAAGDTLTSIVKNNDWSDVATVANVAAANGIEDLDAIRVGQVLRIPV